VNEATDLQISKFSLEDQTYAYFSQ
jgi:hypothetical protein